MMKLKRMMDMQYEHWTANQLMRKLLTMRQQGDETLAQFYKRFVNMVDVVEAQWGLLVPTKIGTDKADQLSNYIGRSSDNAVALYGQ